MSFAQENLTGPEQPTQNDLTAMSSIADKRQFTCPIDLYRSRHAPKDEVEKHSRCFRIHCWVQATAAAAEDSRRQNAKKNEEEHGGGEGGEKASVDGDAAEEGTVKDGTAEESAAEEGAVEESDVEESAAEES